MKSMRLTTGSFGFHKPLNNDGMSTGLSGGLRCLVPEKECQFNPGLGKILYIGSSII